MTTYRDSVLKLYRMRRAQGWAASIALNGARYAAKYGYNDGLVCRISTSTQRKKHDLMPYSDEEARIDFPNGLYAVVKIERDEDSGPPWEGNYHGIVSGWEPENSDTSRWELTSDRYYARYYDWKEAIKVAKRDGWGPGDSMEAVRRDFEYLHGWVNDSWHYVGLTVQLYDADDNLIEEESCWGYESYCKDYLCSEARAWLAHMLKRYRKQKRDAKRQERVANRFRDAMECGL